MVISPDLALSAIRVLGSVAFIVGATAFLVCAIQVYAGKLLRTGPATRGLYAVIRHPQYLALAVSGFGLAILWPRFLTLVLLAIMLFLYYLLARDEERRMLARYGDTYRAFMERTGMLFPRLSSRRPPLPGSPRPLTTSRGLAILAALLVKLGAARDQGGRFLAYFIPIDYTMQGMIADTGPEWKLFGRHTTVRMITDYVLHPVAHLAEGHGHPGAMGHGVAMHKSPALKRRIIFVQVSASGRTLKSPVDDFLIAVARRPLFFADVHCTPGRSWRSGTRRREVAGAACSNSAPIDVKV
jgi:hypothetical protein